MGIFKVLFVPLLLASTATCLPRGIPSFARRAPPVDPLSSAISVLADNEESVRTLLSAAGYQGVAEMWKRQLAGVCDRRLIAQLVGRWKDAVGQAAGDVRAQMKKARETVKNHITDLVGFCKQVLAPAFDGSPKAKRRAVVSSTHAGLEGLGPYERATVSYAEAGRLLTEAARRLVRSLAQAVKSLTRGVANAYLTCLDSMGSMGHRAATELRRLAGLHRVSRLVRILLQRVDEAYNTDLLLSPLWSSLLGDMRKVEAPTNSSGASSVSKWFERRAVAARAAAAKHISSSTSPSSSSSSSTELTVGGRSSCSSQRMVGGHASKLPPPRPRVITVNVRYRFRSGASANNGSNVKPSTGKGASVWLLKPSWGKDAAAQANGSSAFSSSSSLTYHHTEVLTVTAEATDPGTQANGKPVNVQSLKDKRLREAAEGLKNLDAETLTQAYGILGRLDGQFPDAEDVQVTVDAEIDDSDSRFKSWSWLSLILRCVAWSAAGCSLAALLAAVYVHRLPPEVRAVLTPLLQRLSEAYVAARDSGALETIERMWYSPEAEAWRAKLSALRHRIASACCQGAAAAGRAVQEVKRKWEAATSPAGASSPAAAAVSSTPAAAAVPAAVPVAGPSSSAVAADAEGYELVTQEEANDDAASFPAGVGPEDSFIVVRSRVAGQ